MHLDNIDRCDTLHQHAKDPSENELHIVFVDFIFYNSTVGRGNI
jgi:hypothetical protein